MAFRSCLRERAAVTDRPGSCSLCFLCVRLLACPESAECVFWGIKRSVPLVCSAFHRSSRLCALLTATAAWTASIPGLTGHSTVQRSSCHCAPPSLFAACAAALPALRAWRILDPCNWWARSTLTSCRITRCVKIGERAGKHKKVYQRAEAAAAAITHITSVAYNTNETGRGGLTRTVEQSKSRGRCRAAMAIYQGRTQKTELSSGGHPFI